MTKKRNQNYDYFLSVLFKRNKNTNGIMTQRVNEMFCSQAGLTKNKNIECVIEGKTSQLLGVKISCFRGLQKTVDYLPDCGSLSPVKPKY